MDTAGFNKDKTVVGLRQAIRLLDEKNVKKAYIAKDADCLLYTSRLLFAEKCRHIYKHLRSVRTHVYRLQTRR